MKFQNQFDVDAPIEEVWKAILDVERGGPVRARCAGARAHQRQRPQGRHQGEGRADHDAVPRRGRDRGGLDEAKHRAVMHAKAKETRGQGTADATVVMRLEGDESHTHGTIETEVKLSGRAAAMGRGVIQDVSARIVDTFSTNLAEMLGSGAGRKGRGPLRALRRSAAEADLKGRPKRRNAGAAAHRDRHRGGPPAAPPPGSRPAARRFPSLPGGKRRCPSAPSWVRSPPSGCATRRCSPCWEPCCC